jgi:hypothetical protein
MLPVTIRLHFAALSPAIKEALAFLIQPTPQNGVYYNDTLVPCEVKPSTIPGIGNGLFTKQAIPKGSPVIDIDPKTTPQELVEYADLPDSIFESAVEMFVGCPDLKHCLISPVRTLFDATNHSNFPNLAYDWENYKLVALRDVMLGEELFIDYRSEVYPDHIAAKMKGRNFLANA